MTATGSLGLYGDRMYSSTDLNRRAGEVLDDALSQPVTISRNKELFALLRRDQAAAWVRANLEFGPIMDLIAAALCVLEQTEPPASLAWLKAFDQDDLRKMVREVLGAAAVALHETGDWDTVDAIIHEWRESALVALSGVLNDAVESPADESPLPDPRTLAKAETELASE